MLAGLLLIAAILALLGGAAIAPVRWVRMLVFPAMLLWVLAVFAFAGLLAYEAWSIDRTGDVNCAIRGQDSTYVPSHWSWLPPGTSCEYADGDSRPTWWRVPALLALIGAPIAAPFVLRRDADPVHDEVLKEAWLRRRAVGWAVFCFALALVLGAFGYLFFTAFSVF